MLSPDYSFPLPRRITCAVLPRFSPEGITSYSFSFLFSTWSVPPSLLTFRLLLPAFLPSFCRSFCGRVFVLTPRLVWRMLQDSMIRALHHLVQTLPLFRLPGFLPTPAFPSRMVLPSSFAFRRALDSGLSLGESMYTYRHPVLWKRFGRVDFLSPSPSPGFFFSRSSAASIRFPFFE